MEGRLPAFSELRSGQLIVVLNQRREIILPSRLRGVPEYWLVDTEEHSVTSYRLVGATYGDAESTGRPSHLPVPRWI